ARPRQPEETDALHGPHPVEVEAASQNAGAAGAQPRFGSLGGSIAGRPSEPLPPSSDASPVHSREPARPPPPPRAAPKRLPTPRTIMPIPRTLPLPAGAFAASRPT